MDLTDKIVYYVKGKNVFGYYKFGDTLIPVSTNIYKESKQKFDCKCLTKKDAKFQSLILQLNSGKDLSNFKSSPYYQYYIERLKNKYPEYLI